MFWMFLINTIGITLMWVAFWFLLIITQKGGKTSDKNQSFQLWFFLFVLQAGRSGQTNDCSLWVPGPASWQLRVKLADFCDCSLSPAAQLPGSCCTLTRRAQFRNNCSVFSPDAPVLPGHQQQLARPASPVNELLFGIGPGSVSDIGLRSRSRSSSVLLSLLHQSSFFANIGRKPTNLN